MRSLENQRFLIAKPIYTYLTSLILTLVLIAPPEARLTPSWGDPNLTNPVRNHISNGAQVSQNPVAEVQPPDFTLPVLAAPRTPFLTIEDYAAAAAQNAAIDPLKFQRLIVCESQWKTHAQGDNGTSFGLLQFKMQTFAHFTKKYGTLGTDIESPHHQIDLAAQMIANGHLDHWKNCARKIGWAL